MDLTYEAYSVRMYAMLKREVQCDPNNQPSDGNFDRLLQAFQEVADELKLMKEEHVFLKQALEMLATRREERDNIPTAAIRTEVSVSAYMFC